MDKPATKRLEKRDAEKKVETLFNKYRKSIIKQFGVKPLYDDQIDTFARAQQIPKYGGVFPHDKLPNKSGAYIVNTGNSRSAGIHWIALVRTKSNDYIYDSFSRPKHTILKSFHGHGRKSKMSDQKDLEQHDEYVSQENICGHLSLSWLLVYRDLGIKHAMLI